ncbi:U7 snRNA-associated Sm-like protein LSm11 isoform X2 [Rhinatrema bivittatum]|uniref:U7 snRNA-associated Sm-like protein LSm11 isoform X2 n=1 Tax=Rhinatrema bivittatum TaxID=194408 RepID=UPI00112D4FC2|nr:U7 snRNA-associated Sm-like protein LSm11 isoform X2 [Rhinatrema bivittatum]
MEEEERQGAGVVAAAASSLDVSSELFDPLLALYSPCTPIPFPNVRCFNNLAEYESFLQRGGLRARGAPSSRKASKLRKHRGPPPPDPARIERLKQLMVTREGEGEGAPREPRRKRIPKNVLTRMPREYRGIVLIGFWYPEPCSEEIIQKSPWSKKALTDVDETYRKPVLGKAFFHEPQLTLTRLFDRLKIQESRLQAGDESQASLRRPVAAEEVKPSAESQQGRATGEGKGPAGDHEEAPQGTSAATACKPSEGSSIPGGKVKEPRVDYQQVFTRHMKQVFIRGENVLLVHLAP